VQDDCITDEVIYDGIMCIGGNVSMRGCAIGPGATINISLEDTIYHDERD
jgi:hypothetical protein